MAGTLPTPATLHVRAGGSGPRLLLLHGLGGDHTVWNSIFDRLAERCSVLAPDLRGHGRSPLPEGSTLGFDELRRDLDALCDDRRWGSVHVAGLSAGAFLALDWAANEPNRVRSLVLIGGATHCDAHTRAVGQRWIDLRQKEGPAAYAWRVVKDLFSADWIEAHLDLAEAIVQDLAARDVRGAALWSRSVRSFDLRGRFGRFAVPTLAMQGMDDHVVDSSHVRLLRQSLTGTQIRLFPNTGHLVPVERPAECATAILEWALGHEGPSAGPPAAEPPADGKSSSARGG